MTILFNITGRLTLLTFVAYGMAHRAVAQSQYSITDLGTLPGFDSSQAAGVNASANVAGWLSNNATQIDHAFVSGPLQDLGTLSGFSSSAALAINGPSQTAGSL